MQTLLQTLGHQLRQASKNGQADEAQMLITEMKCKDMKLDLQEEEVRSFCMACGWSVLVC